MSVLAWLCIFAFSATTNGACAAKSVRNTEAFCFICCHLTGSSVSHETPALERYVHGGWHITKSHPWS